MSLQFAVVVLPHRDEDECFVRNNWFGVADGLGSVPNSGEYAKKLMQNCDTFSGTSQDPTELLFRSHAATECAGASTIAAGVLLGRTIQAATCGDSGIMIVRDGKLLFKTSPLQGEFNSTFCFRKGSVGPVQSYSQEVQEGDLVIAATDGLFDWVHTNNIIRVVKKEMNLQDCAVKLARKAKVAMHAATPYYWRVAKESAGMHQRDQIVKVDDITVVLARVVSNPELEPCLIRRITDEDIDLDGALESIVGKHGDSGDSNTSARLTEPDDAILTEFRGAAKVVQDRNASRPIEAVVKGRSIGIGYYLDSSLSDDMSLSSLEELWEDMESSRPTLLGAVDVEQMKMRIIFRDARVLVIREGRVVAAASTGLQTSTFDCDIRTGDIMVMGTSYVFDRLFESRILKTISKSVADGVDEVAKKLIQKASVPPFPLAHSAIQNRIQGRLALRTDGNIAVAVGVVGTSLPGKRRLGSKRNNKKCRRRLV